MRWRLFRSSARAADTSGWWRQAEAAAEAPSADVVSALRQSVSRDSADESERQHEMVEGLEALAALVAAPIPIVDTQHRVIGTDVCHFLAPVTLQAEAADPAKLFLTSRRIVVASSKVRAWPWHRLGVARIGRDLLVSVSGAEAAVHLQCNTYTDALCALHLAAKLRSARE